MSSIIDAMCRTCKSVRKHDVLAEIDDSKSETYYASGAKYDDGSDSYDIHFWNYFKIIKCRGCETIAFMETKACSEHQDFETGGYDTDVDIYPDPNPISHREPLAAYKSLPKSIQPVYTETLKVYNAGAALLSALGLRTLVEAVCLDVIPPADLKKTTKKGDLVDKNLKEKIDTLVSNGNLSRRQGDLLHVHRFLGNEAAHEIEAPPFSEIDAALDLIEGLLVAIYHLPTIADVIRASRASRGKKV